MLLPFPCCSHQWMPRLYLETQAYLEGRNKTQISGDLKSSSNHQQLWPRNSLNGKWAELGFLHLGHFLSFQQCWVEESQNDLSRGKRGQVSKYLKNSFLYKHVYRGWRVNVGLLLNLILHKWVFHLCLCMGLFLWCIVIIMLNQSKNQLKKLVC